MMPREKLQEETENPNGTLYKVQIMQKVMIGLYVPVLQEKFDACVPADTQIDQLISLLVKCAAELRGGHYIPSKPGFLMQKESDRTLWADKLLENYGIGDGSQLVLF